MMPDQRPTGPRLPQAKPRWMSDEQWERTPPEPEPRPVLDLGTVVVMGVLTVVSFTLMVLGAVKLGELVRLAVRWW
jgi:hypothetical protein